MEDDRLIIVDIETTGLNVPYSAQWNPALPEDLPLEYGVRIVDLDLSEIDNFQCLIWDSPNYDERLRQGLVPVVAEMHSTLIEECLAEGESIEEAATKLTDFLTGHRVAKGDPICGSSVQFDRGVLQYFAPEAHSLFHYRNVDCSSIKELCRRFNPEVYKHLPEPKKLHRVIPDMEDTTEELRFYLREFSITTLGNF